MTHNVEKTRRLVLLARKLDSGGAERQLVALAKGMKDHGCDVHVVTFYPHGVFDPELQKHEVPLHPIGKKGRWDVLGFAKRLFLVLRDLQPHVIYSFLDFPNILTVLSRPFLKRPKLIWSIRASFMEMGHYDLLARSLSSLEARLSNRPDLIIANSHAGKTWARERGFPEEKLVVIENGIDTKRFQPEAEAGANLREAWQVPSEAWLIGHVGRLDPMKDHESFLRACAALAKRRDDVHFVCVGDGPLAVRERYVALADQLGLGQRLIWAGLRTDMPAVYSALDVLVSSSAYGEGFPNVVGEAMACGVPCVVTDVGDSARIVGELGDVVPPRRPEALAEAMARMLDRLARGPDLPGQVRQRIVEAFSLARMVTRTETVLSEVVSQD